MQTKLTKSQKAETRAMIEDFESMGGEIMSFPSQGIVIAMIPAFPGSRMANVGVSHMAPSETCFRYLVGARLAIWRAEGYFQVPVQPLLYSEFATQLVNSIVDVTP